MDAAVFMAAICPVAAAFVFPLALADRGSLGMSGTGWTYTLILTLLSGVAANGLMAFAQRSIQVGTIAVAQVVQPAIAVVWSLTSLGETLRGWQIVGIVISMGGPAAFLVFNERGERASQSHVVIGMLRPARARSHG